MTEQNDMKLKKILERAGAHFIEERFGKSGYEKFELDGCLYQGDFALANVKRDAYHERTGEPAHYCYVFMVNMPDGVSQVVYEIDCLVPDQSFPHPVTKLKKIKVDEKRVRGTISLVSNWGHGRAEDFHVERFYRMTFADDASGKLPDRSKIDYWK